MVAVPAAAVLVNNDLVSSVRSLIATQLHINIVQTAAEFEAAVNLDSEFIDNVRRAGKRLMVIRDADDHEPQQRNFDVVLFYKNGLISVQQNNFGPPGATFQVPKLHWGQLCIYERQIGYVAPSATYNACGQSSGSSLFRYIDGTYECDGYGCFPTDQPLVRCCSCCGFPYGPFRSLSNSATQRQPQTCCCNR